MFVKNTMKEDIGPVVHAGYEFILLANKVSVIWDEAGKSFLKNNFKLEAKTPEDGGAPVPPLLEVEQKDWDGKTFAQVTRFKIDYTRIPNRNDLIRIAEERGMGKNGEKGEEFMREVNRDGSTVDQEEIVNEINALPVPEEIRFPEVEELAEEVPVTEPQV